MPEQEIKEAINSEREREPQILLTLEISIHKSSVLMALPDCCVSRARDTPSARVFTRPLTKSAAAAFRTWLIAFHNKNWVWMVKDNYMVV